MFRRKYYHKKAGVLQSPCCTFDDQTHRSEHNSAKPLCQLDFEKRHSPFLHL